VSRPPITQGLINVKSFQARPEEVRPEGPKCEARRAESGGGVLEEGAASPLPTSSGVWGSIVSSPSGVWGGAPAKIEFDAFYL